MIAELMPSLEPAPTSPWLGRHSPAHWRHRQELRPGVWVLRAVADPKGPQPELWPIWALCGGMDEATFFGRDTNRQPLMKRNEVINARRICSGCPVVRECLRHALTLPEEYGVWGGTSKRQREREMGPKLRAGASVDEVVDDWLRTWLTHR